MEIPDLLSPTLPEWNGATILWKWRLPEYRPTELQLKIFSEYWRGYYAASVSAHSKFVDSNGVFIGTPKDIPLIQRRRKLAERRLPKELMKRHKLTQPELEQMLAYVWVWRHGEKPTDELIEQTVATFREEWRAPPP